MLTEPERGLVRRLWSQGPSVLLDEGYTTAAMRKFIARPEVVAEMALLEEEFRHSKVISARTRYVTTRNLAKLSEGAAAVLARAMAGPVFDRHPETKAILTDARGNPILREAETSANQIRAATSVLGALGVGDTRVHAEQHVGDFQINLLIESADEAPDLGADPKHTTEEERALSRERVRNTIEELLLQLPDIKEKALVGLGLKAAKKKVTKKKRGKKKVTKKKRGKKKVTKRTRSGGGNGRAR